MNVFLKQVFGNRGVLMISPYHYNGKFKKQYSYNRAVNEAEKIVGYPTSFLRLRWLLNDELVNVALHMRKLIGTNHPLLNTAKELILNKQTPAWGLIVLLISKAGGLSREFLHVECDITAGILHSQRNLAEITEMVRTSNIIHKSILNISSNDKDIDVLNFGNKLSLLTGDYLLSSSCKELAELKCHDVNELISTCLRDLVEADFIEPRDSQNRPIPSPPLKEHKEVVVSNQFDDEVLTISEVLGNAKAEWTLRHLLDGASLLAKCCQGTLILAGHPKSFQKLGYLFGRNMALGWQARADLSAFNPLRTTEPFSLICAPLMFHLQDNQEYYPKFLKMVEENDIDYRELRNVIRTGHGLEKTNKMLKELSETALKVLEEFPDNSSRDALVNIINSA
ncbi:all trans-polyprenyl-diphosphate synthase PDSS2-like isoform X1 [Leptinotarsa decemlineata]|uniref:all trans-polyprenyl-diphosphate synthase PDSS2-like isoform X1 n=3 Tax=Leptinotarsa decemlineata TaxID=7539 RepID=UPI003D30BC6A